MKALIQVIAIPSADVAECAVVAEVAEATLINVGDKIENRLYRNGRFLRISCAGEFGQFNIPCRLDLEQTLRKMGCEVQAEPDRATELVILAEPVEQMVPFDDAVHNYLELRQRINLEEMLASEIEIYWDSN